MKALSKVYFHFKAISPSVVLIHKKGQKNGVLQGANCLTQYFNGALETLRC